MENKSSKKDNHILRLSNQKNSQKLLFFGARHTNDISDFQFKEIAKLFKEFTNFKIGEGVVFVESRINKLPKSYEDSIKQFGEVGATHWLASKHQLEVIYPEPTDTEQRQNLCSHFDPQLVAYSLIVQNLSAWFRHSRQSNFDQAIERSITREQKFLSIYGFSIDLSWFLNFHSELFPNKKNDERQFLDLISNPTKKDTKVNEVIGCRTKIRNDFILKNINDHWLMQENIFIVYGRGHLSSLRASLIDIVYGNEANAI